MKSIFIYLALIFLVYSCKQEKKSTNKIHLKEGFVLLEQSCFSCHSPNASIDNKVAPTMEAIKRHYISSNTSQDEFTKDLISFINNPSKDISKMPDAIEKFNLMPKMDVAEDQIRKMAEYIYNTELEKPDWFSKHYQEEKQKYGSPIDTTSSPLDIGKNIATQTKSVLGKYLLEAINTRGTENAVSFCSTKAIPITDSMALVLNAKIKRVSDRNRNPDNEASAEELVYINNIKSAIAEKSPVKPQVVTANNKTIGYYPIITNDMCLQCHGQPNKDISSKTRSKIKSIYPKDKAIGYKADELRGIWVIEMDKK